MRMQFGRLCRAVCLFLLSLVLPASVASALPTMIRLGYTSCAACHLSPQGGGLLTPYGKGIDTAQSLFREEPSTPDEQLRSLYDVRAVLAASMLSSEQNPGTLSASTLRTTFRNAVNMSSHTRVSYQAGLDATMTGNTTMAPAVGTGDIVVSRAIFEYHPRDGVSLQVGRDALPDGVGLPDPQLFMRRQHDPFGTTYPIQAKAFLWNAHYELTPYVYGPGFDETRRVARQHGGGVVGGLDIGKRAVVGMTARTSYSDTFDRKSVGAYARLGFGHWGVLAEHDLTSRVVPGPAPAPADYVLGYTQLFVYPAEWFLASLIVDDVDVSGSATKHAYRIAPAVSMRLSNNFTLGFTTRNEVVRGPAPDSRTYLISLAVKSVQ
jgi:hypothetical protein